MRTTSSRTSLLSISEWIQRNVGNLNSIQTYWTVKCEHFIFASPSCLQWEVKSFHFHLFFFIILMFWLLYHNKTTGWISCWPTLEEQDDDRFTISFQERSHFLSEWSEMWLRVERSILYVPQVVTTFNSLLYQLLLFLWTIALLFTDVFYIQALFHSVCRCVDADWLWILFEWKRKIFHVTYAISSLLIAYKYFSFSKDILYKLLFIVSNCKYWEANNMVY